MQELGEVMAETNCFECGRLHDTYNAATIQYMKFCECASSTRDAQQGNQLFTDMNDAMMAFMSHRKTHPLSDPFKPPKEAPAKMVVPSSFNVSFLTQ